MAIAIDFELNDLRKRLSNYNDSDNEVIAGAAFWNRSINPIENFEENDSSKTAAANRCPQPLHQIIR